MATSGEPSGVGEPADVAELTEAIREFVRTRHPDRGGDPEAFAEGLTALRARLAHAQAQASTPVPVFGAARRSRGLVGWLRARGRRQRGSPRVR